MPQLKKPAAKLGKVSITPGFNLKDKKWAEALLPAGVKAQSDKGTGKISPPAAMAGSKD